MKNPQDRSQTPRQIFSNGFQGSGPDNIGDSGDATADSPSWDLTPAERRRAAAHEAGHALIGWSCMCITSIPLVTITEIGGLTGWLFSPMMMDAEIMFWELITATMGGIAAEGMFLGNFRTKSAERDLLMSLAVARGLAEANDGRAPGPPWKEYLYSTHDIGTFYTGSHIEQSARDILNICYARARAVLHKHHFGHLGLTDFIDKHGKAYGPDVLRILGDRPWALPR